MGSRRRCTARSPWSAGGCGRGTSTTTRRCASRRCRPSRCTSCPARRIREASGSRGFRPSPPRWGTPSSPPPASACGGCRSGWGSRNASHRLPGGRFLVATARPGRRLRAMARLRHVVLIPGFFGFANLGDFTYFGHVRDFLAEAWPGLGLDGEVRAVRTEPTASLPRRAALLAEAISALLDDSPGEVAVVGHSSGGLDARLLLAPGARLPTGAD